MDKYIAVKRKSKDEDLDDSIDFFLPNKLREKKKINQHYKKSRTTNHRQRKNDSPKSNSSSSSNLSLDTYDTDIEFVKAVCLSKSECNITDRISSKKNRETISNNWKELTSKMKRQPLLKTRTASDREAILSEKLALILVDNCGNEVCNNDNFSILNMDDFIHSEFLVKHWCKKSRLWSAAKQPFDCIKDFYIVSFSDYIDIDLYSESKSSNINYETTLNLDIERDENIFKSEDVELANMSSFIAEKSPEKSSFDIFDNKLEEITDNVQSTSNVNLGKDILLTSDRQSNNIASSNKANVDDVASFQPTVTDNITVISSSSPQSNCTLHLSNNSNDDDNSQCTFSPPPSISSLVSEWKNKKTDMLDRIGVTLLADQWDNLFQLNDGDVMVLLDNETTLNVHKFVLNVRCQQLCYEINDEHQIYWKIYSLDVAKAFFRYIYSGKCDHLWQLSIMDKNTVKRMARLYQLSHLEEVLKKFHSTEEKSFSSKNSITPSSNHNGHMESKTVENFNSFLHTDPKIQRKCGGSLYCTDSIYEQISPKHLTPMINKVCEQDFEEKQSVSVGSELTVKNIDEIVDISSPLSEGDINSYDYIFRSSSPEYRTKTRLSETNSHCHVKKSLEAYFQESFTEHSSSVNPIIVGETNPEKNRSPYISSKSSLSSPESLEKDTKVTDLFVDTLSLTSRGESTESTLPDATSSDRPYVTSTSSTSNPIKPHLLSLQHTPSTSTSDIIFSKIATPYPEYDSMITPDLKKELKKFGLKQNLEATKAKLILKYIYDQTHPVVEFPQDNEKKSSLAGTLCASENISPLSELVSNLVKSNKELHTHILMFKPIWLEKLYHLMKENGIHCSLSELKDALNELCITYRTKNTRTNKYKQNIQD